MGRPVALRVVPRVMAANKMLAGSRGKGGSAGTTLEVGNTATCRQVYF
jgi:hypothetical protein